MRQNTTLQPLKPHMGEVQFTFKTIWCLCEKKSVNVPHKVSQEVCNGEYMSCSTLFLSVEFLFIYVKLP